MKLYIIRHGQTDWNIAKKIQGRQDIPLNERGHFQAQCLGKAMENRPITAVFSSPQIRAMETAIAVASPAGVPVIPVRDLMEINYGVWEEMTEPCMRHGGPIRQKQRLLRERALTRSMSAAVRHGRRSNPSLQVMPRLWLMAVCWDFFWIAEWRSLCCIRSISCMEPGKADLTGLHWLVR